jgi:hypothetical protein
MRKLATLFLILISAPSFATDRLVSTLGTDTGDCSSSACATIEYAWSQASPGDTVSIGAGTFYEKDISTSTSGTSESPIIIRGTVDEGSYQTIIDGSSPLSPTWVASTEYGNGCYKTAGVSTVPKVVLVYEDDEWLRVHVIQHALISGTSTGTTASKLVDSGASFTSELEANPGFGMYDGWVAYNATDDTTTNVSAVDSGTTLSLDDDIFTSGESYKLLPPSLGYDSDYQITTYSTSVLIDYWDGVEALAWHDGDETLYIRFRDGSSPSGKTFRYAGGTSIGNVFHTVGANHITIENIWVRGAWYNISVNGSTGVLLNNIYSTCSAKHVYVQNSANLDIVDCVIPNSSYSLQNYSWGAWTGGSSQTDAVAEHIYRVAKYEVSDEESSGEQCNGIDIIGGGTATVYGCNVSDVSSAISASYETTYAEFYDNNVANTEQSFFLGKGTPGDIYDNLSSNSNLHVRFGNMEDCYSQECLFNIYRNRFWNVQGVGSGFYIHYSDVSGSHSTYPTGNWYHNVFLGGVGAISLSSYCDDHGGLPNFNFYNNIISSGVNFFYGAQSLYESSTQWGDFSYNWVGCETLAYSKEPSWPGSGNIYDTGGDKYPWGLDSQPDFVLPGGHAGRLSGVDISEIFTTDDGTKNPLDGFSPGYFDGAAPNMGWSQDIEYTPAVNVMSGGSGTISAGSGTISAE